MIGVHKLRLKYMHGMAMKAKIKLHLNLFANLQQFNYAKSLYQMNLKVLLHLVQRDLLNFLGIHQIMDMLKVIKYIEKIF